MIQTEEIPVENIEEFFDMHITYLVEDEIITEEEDIEYFKGEEYRGIIKAHMVREVDKQHMVYFVRDGERIGVASYCIY